MTSPDAATATPPESNGPMLWLNGPFGVGKTATAHLVKQVQTGWRLFDPEWVGFMLRANLEGWPMDDFQDLPPWRRLVPQVARSIIDLTGDPLLAVQTVLDQEIWNDLRRGLADHRLKVTHVLLDVDDQALRKRIEADEIDPHAREWRLEHIGHYRSARPWLTATADLVIDTTDLPANEVATRIVANHWPLQGTSAIASHP
jgi:hypothetical protein